MALLFTETGKTRSGTILGGFEEGHSGMKKEEHRKERDAGCAS